MRRSTVGKYRIIGEIGRGSMGLVYRAVDPGLGREVAVKVLHPELASPSIVARFFDEARATARIRHSGIVGILDHGFDSWGQAFIAMELLSGEHLGQRLDRERTLGISAVKTLGLGLADALGAAHLHGIVHRDLKPENVFLTAAGIKLLDFGIAKLMEGGGPGRMPTRTGMVMGTPLYMSPEQCRGSRGVDHRTDIYALGCMLFEMATGRPPFVVEGLGPLMAAQMYARAPRLCDLDPALPQALGRLIERCLEKDPAARPHGMGEIAQELVRVPTPSKTMVAAVAPMPRSMISS